VRRYTTDAFAEEIHVIVTQLWELPPPLRSSVAS
jgi:hypothetical protein